MSSNYKDINFSELKKKIDKVDDFILIDVRTKQEYDSGYIKSAINVPLDNILSIKDSKEISSDCDIVLYCRSGMRGRAAAEKLVQNGYTNVYCAGGIMNWPYELVKKV